MTIPFQEARPYLTSPGGRFRYQLWFDEDDELDLTTLKVWRRDKDGSWLADMVIHLDQDLTGPAAIAHSPGEQPEEDEEMLAEYMRAAGHIWSARTGGLWTMLGEILTEGLDEDDDEDGLVEDDECDEGCPECHPDRYRIERTKWIADGEETLADAANALRKYADYLDELGKQGWELIHDVDDGYLHLEKKS